MYTKPAKQYLNSWQSRFDMLGGSKDHVTRRIKEYCIRLMNRRPSKGIAL